MKIIMPGESIMREQNGLYQQLKATLRGEYVRVAMMLTDENFTEAQKRYRIRKGVASIKKRWGYLEEAKKELGCNSGFWPFEKAYGSAKETIKQERKRFN